MDLGAVVTLEATKRTLINNMDMDLWLIEVTEFNSEVRFELGGSEAARPLPNC